jgi:hypothetical protein
MRFAQSFPALCAAVMLTAAASAQITLSPLTTFGGGDGWLNAAGDSPYLGTGNLERGIAYSPVNNHLYLVSRLAGGPFVRVLDGTTGADLGSLNTSGVTGGTFPLNKVVVDPGTGTIYATNLRTGTNDPGFRMYRWDTEASSPTMIFDFMPDATNPRIGDNLDLIGTGANAQIVAGYNAVTTAANSNGYLVINPTASALSPTLPAFNNVTFPEGGVGGTADGDFRLGITFLAASDADSGVVLGTPGSSATAARLTNYGGALDDRTSISGTLIGNVGLSVLTERAFDYISFAGMGLLATVDTLTGGNSLVRLYDASNPSAPVLLTSLSNTTGASNANANSGGDIRFGAMGVDANNLPTVTLYAMNTNNGIQAFVVSVPEPSAVAMLGIGVIGACVRRRR